MPSNNQISVTGDLTISCWVKFNSMPSDRFAFLSKPYNGVEYGTYQLELNKAGANYELRGLTRVADSFQTVSYTCNPSTGVWYHVVYTRVASTGAQTLYVNGSPAVASVNASGTAQSDNSPLYVGLFEPTVVSEGLSLDGFLDELGLWNVALNAANVSGLYNLGNGNPYPFISGSGAVVKYAYSPYGRLLGSTNSQLLSPNPYTFVGSQGVMEELPGLYFMRARYYSAEAGVFLSTDPVKKIGPGWKSAAYLYANDSPHSFADSKGEEPVTIAFVASLGVAFCFGVVEELVTHYVHQTIEDSVEEMGGESAGLLAKGALASLSVYSAGNKVVKAASPDPWTKAILAGNVITSAVLSGKDIVAQVRTLNSSGGSRSTTLSSPTAGTTPAATRIPSQPNGGNQSLSIRTVTAAAVAPAANGGSSRPSGSSSGGGTTSSGGTYTVRPGDTLGNIGYANGTTATAIGQANGIHNLNQIRPGQVLTIPGRR